MRPSVFVGAKRERAPRDWPKATLRDEAKLPLKAISPKGYATRTSPVNHFVFR
ncbi:MAG: hypothetical protein F6K50_39905 [Moorea sp. SIO3I7]|uniref:hypothetical protein n=1 Tax=unclassified Moorena TaxID=2683338 RepID=UPI0013C73EE1|nr:MULTISPECIES: hypothetical protein [unclassified Moorena]NEO01349.1 hypothetical protein [Moorena sp. SIO3I7]NEO25298.1 hypothetical protein [Moorena sp. SIO4A5]NEQ63167.1 hypothetical protein [Moorena sp. SIO4A1]